ncbi:hypothetical protein [Pandoravirus japonicus]|uniref:Uncharacterized protein n=1 Tax=Pandoravirus japonicus TaxID=2823154 RepID=A0A811BT92_9VIRU|nr:hypothetical protein [Pandoravirus japonicus]
MGAGPFAVLARLCFFWVQLANRPDRAILPRDERKRECACVHVCVCVFGCRIKRTINWKCTCPSKCHLDPP